MIMGTKLAEITMAKQCIAAKQELMFLQAEFDELIALSCLRTPALDQLRRQ
jgi:hypothetical protein